MFTKEATIKYVDYFELMEEVEKRLGCDTRSFHKYYLERDEQWATLKQEHMKRIIDKDPPMKRALEKGKLSKEHEEAVMAMFEATFAVSDLGKLMEDKSCRMDFWSVIINVVTYAGFNRAGYTSLPFYEVLKQAPWSRPIVDCIYEILKPECPNLLNPEPEDDEEIEDGVIYEDYYQTHKMFFYVDW